MTDRIGTPLGGYQLVRLIAKEDKAELYLGEQQYTHAQALLKIFRVPLVADKAIRYREEARRLTSLFHPHLLRVFDVGIEADTAFLVMEYPPEGTMRDQHPTGTTVPLEQVLRITQQIAEALHYLHTQGLAHGDLRPEHLWFKRQNELLLDNPLLLSLALPGSSLSTPYLAPEAAQGSATPASDQYSLGAMVYEWLSGTPPEGPAPLHPPGPRPQRGTLRERVPSLSPAIEDAVLTALAADPAQRFPSVQDFANALQETMLDAFATPPAASLMLTESMPQAQLPDPQTAVPAAEPAPSAAPAQQPKAPPPSAHPPSQEATPGSPAPQPATPGTSPMPRSQPAAQQAAHQSASTLECAHRRACADLYAA